MSWHRIHRPKKISDLDLTSVRETLQQWMKKGKMPQVMLFAGPKGTGKTSTARIIGAMLNDPDNSAVVEHLFFQAKPPKKLFFNEPSNETSFAQKIFAGHSYVVRELDAASNRGIDDVRSLKERVALPPQEGKIAVYILDEAHMLTTEAFNALLKLLEEPPPHVVFILATTEKHKIPATVISRCSVVEFHQATVKELAQTLSKISKLEKLKSEGEALDLIAQRAEGSFRDGVKLLEMISHKGDNITVATVTRSLNGSVDSEVKELLTALLEKDKRAVVEIFESLRQNQTNESFFYHQLIDFLHHSLLQSIQVHQGEPFVSESVSQFLLKELSLIQINSSIGIMHLDLELKILELIGRSQDKSGKKKSLTLSKTQDKQEGIIKSEKEEYSQPKNPGSKEEKLSPKTNLATGDSKMLIDHWDDLLKAVKSKNFTLEALLRSARPISGVNGLATIEVFYSFHKEQLEQPKFKSLIEECTLPLAGGLVELKYVLAQTPKSAELVEKEKDDNLVTLAEKVLV